MVVEVKVLDKITPFHYVYFVRANETGLTKIGRTKNLGQRFAGLKSRVGPLTLLCCIPTFDSYLETQILKILRSHSIDGKEREWFTLPEEVLFIVIKEVLRGFRNWSEEPTPRIQNGRSFFAIKDGVLKATVPSIPPYCNPQDPHAKTEAQ